MATPTISSTSSASNWGGNSVTVTAPSGIQNGDVLLAFVGSLDNAGMTPPSGFTLIISQTNATRSIYCYYKVASSESGNYTFTNTTSGKAASAAMYRVTGNTSTQFNYDVGVSAGPTVTITDTIKKQTESALFITSISNDNVTSSSYTITHGTSNPTWTEVIDAITTTPSDYSFANAYATTSNVSDITEWGYVFAGSPGLATQILVVMLSPQSSSGTCTTLGITPGLNTGTGTSGSSGTSTVLAITPTFNTGIGAVNNTRWSNQSKPAISSVSNQTKP